MTIAPLNCSNSYSQLPEGFYTRLSPTPLQGSHHIALSEGAAALIDLTPQQLLLPQHLAWQQGRAPLPGGEPLAMIYAGHQFGHYVPQLGDGRAIMLGEVTNQRGERWELQLKGAGRTPYSRDGDGRAVLRSTIREFLGSEAMHALAIPTTRALSISGSKEPVYREQIETGALLVRMAPSHLRFGSFELFYYRHQYESLRQLADHLLNHHFPQLWQHPSPYLALLQQVVGTTAQLISQWQQVGFTHGVLNTDNMSMLGLTLDYGPYGFLDHYQADFVCNHTDHQGRYAYDQQPTIGLWNLSRLAQALLPLIPGAPQQAVEQATAVLDGYQEIFDNHYWAGMGHKLGLEQREVGDSALIEGLLALMGEQRADFTRTFRGLSRFDPHQPEQLIGLMPTAGALGWGRRYAARLIQQGGDSSQRRAAMDRKNPKYILRNYLAQRAIEAAETGDYSELHRLQRLLQRPFDEQPECEHYAAQPPEWGAGLMLSCSS